MRRRSFFRLPLPLLALSLLLGAAVPSCTRKATTYTPDFSNHPPVVRGMAFSPQRVHAHQRIRVTALASDPEGDRLTYRWKASRGSFPEGSGASTVYWRTPDTAGTDTLTVVVSDLLHDVTGTTLVPEVDLAGPDSLSFASGASSAVVRWRRSADDPLVGGIDTLGYGWQGYEVFRATRSFAEIPDSLVIAYRITDPAVQRDSLRVTGLTAGVRYWFRVSARRTWEGVIQKSPPSEEIDLAPRPEYTLDVPERTWALDLSAGAILLPLDPADASGIAERDIYFGSADSLDAPADPGAPETLRLKSVSLLANRNPQWASRVVEIQAAGLDWHIATVPGSDWRDQADLEIGRVYILRLPEGNYAKLQASFVRGAYPYGRILLRWAYQTIPNYANF